jgi:hypothetical protein
MFVLCVWQEPEGPSSSRTALCPGRACPDSLPRRSRNRSFLGKSQATGRSPGIIAAVLVAPVFDTSVFAPLSGGMSALAWGELKALITRDRNQEKPTAYARARTNNTAASFQFCRSTWHWDSHLHPRPLGEGRRRSQENTGCAYVFSYGCDLDRIIRTDCQQSQLTNREPWLLSPVHVAGGTEIRDFLTRFIGRLEHVETALSSVRSDYHFLHILNKIGRA